MVSVPDLREAMGQRPVFGTFLKLGRREAVDIAKRVGFDFAICDLEHAQLSEEEARLTILAGAAANLPIVVRVADLDRGLINRLLEAGAAGIQVPRVRRREDVLELRQVVHYPPQGSRSISLAQPAAGYGAESLAQYLQRANGQVLLVGQLETREMEQPLELVLNGLDVAFIGTVDLSVDMGVPGRLDEPTIRERIQAIEQAAVAAGAHLGLYVDSAARAAQAAAAGYRYIALSSDLGMLQGAMRSVLQQIQEHH